MNNTSGDLNPNMLARLFSSSFSVAMNGAARKAYSEILVNVFFFLEQMEYEYEYVFRRGNCWDPVL